MDTFRSLGATLDRIPPEAAKCASGPLHDRLIVVGEQSNQRWACTSVLKRLERLDRNQLAEALQGCQARHQLRDRISTTGN